MIGEGLFHCRLLSHSLLLSRIRTSRHFTGEERGRARNAASAYTSIWFRMLLLLLLRLRVSLLLLLL